MASIAENHSTETFSRWRPFWYGITDNYKQHLMTVDMSREWRTHLIWSKPEGEELRRALTQKFSSTTMILSVILATEIGVLTNPSKPADDVRVAFKAREYDNLEYWTGMTLGIAIFFSIGAVISNYTAWSLFTAISDKNLRVIARSSIGLYCAQLPNVLIVFTLYFFFLWVAMFWFVLMPLAAATCLFIGSTIFLAFVISTYSALGSLAIHSGALSPDRVVDETVENDMTPLQISEELLRLKRKSKKSRLSINQQYTTRRLQAVRNLKAESMKELKRRSSLTPNRNNNNNIDGLQSMQHHLHNATNDSAISMKQHSLESSRTSTTRGSETSDDRKDKDD